MRKILLFLISFAIIAMLDISTTFAQQSQQQRANNATPYTVAIHRLNNISLNDSLLIEVEDTTNYFSRRTSVGDLKNYVNASNTKQVVYYNFYLAADTTVAITDSSSIPATDADGDTITAQISYYRTGGVNPTITFNFYKKGTGDPSNMTNFYVTQNNNYGLLNLKFWSDNVDTAPYGYSYLGAQYFAIISQLNIGNPVVTDVNCFITIEEL